MPRKTRDALVRNRLAARRKAVVQKVAKKARKAAAPKMVEVRITRSHSINGVMYNTSPVTVRQDIADVLLGQERRALAEERRARDTEPNDILIGGRRPGGGYRLYKLQRDSLSDQTLLTTAPVGFNTR